MSDEAVRTTLLAKLNAGLVEVRVLDDDSGMQVAAYPALEISVSPENGRVVIVIGDRRG